MKEEDGRGLRACVSSGEWSVKARRGVGPDSNCVDVCERVGMKWKRGTERATCVIVRQEVSVCLD